MKPVLHIVLFLALAACVGGRASAPPPVDTVTVTSSNFSDSDPTEGGSQCRFEVESIN